MSICGPIPQCFVQSLRLMVGLGKQTTLDLFIVGMNECDMRVMCYLSERPVASERYKALSYLGK